MTGATITNLVIGEYAVMVTTLLLGVLAGFVGWARFRQRDRRPQLVQQPATG